MKKLTLLLILAFTAVTFPAPAFCAATPVSQSTKNDSFHMEALRVASLLNSLGEQTHAILTSDAPDESMLETYMNTILMLCTYADSEVVINDADLQLISEAFQNFSNAGGNPMSIEDIKADLSRFETLGDMMTYLGGALLEGMAEE